jgi:DNA repair exonuclease SbcCD ATPase subunit/DNA repair exonuclease SbcCD nuclease subunit
MIILKKAGIIKRIYHISDIHIRKMDRHEEYRKVFERLYKKIEEDVNKKEILILITGDVLHSDISSDSIVMVKMLYIKLSEICPIITIHGNHDLVSRSDANKNNLSPILLNLKTEHDIYFLEKPGVYIYGNIAFGYTGMFDKEIMKIEVKNKTKIALYHGIVAGAKNMNNMLLSTSENFRPIDFSDYEYCMLGDIHLFQNLSTEKTKIYYASSIIQQNFSEDTMHGCLLWDLEEETETYIPIENDYGFITIDIKNDVYKLPSNLPLHTYLRLRQYESSDEIVDKIHKSVSQKTNIISYSVEKSFKEYNYSQKVGDTTESIEIKNDKMALKRLMDYIGKNDEIEKVLTETIKKIDYDYTSSERIIKLKKLSFDNFNVYAENNNIDYTALNGIMNISGPNGIGKSSLSIYCLLYALFGEFEGISKKEYMNTKKKTLNTKIIFDVNNVEHTIERNLYYKGKELKCDVLLFKKKEDISGKNLTEIEKQIRVLLGESEKFMETCIMGQKYSGNFLDKSDVDKYKYISLAIKMDVYNKIVQEMSSQSRLLNSQINERNSLVYIDKKKEEYLDDKKKEILTKLVKEIEELEDDILNEETELKIKNKEKLTIEIKIDNIHIMNNEKESKIRERLVDNKSKYEEIRLKKQENIEDKRKIYNNKIEELEKKINRCRTEYVNNVKPIDNIEKKEKELRNILEKEKEIKKEIKTKNVDIELYTFELSEDSEIEEKNKKYMELMKELCEINNKLKFTSSKLKEVDCDSSMSLEELDKCLGDICVVKNVIDKKEITKLKKLIEENKIKIEIDIEEKYNKYVDIVKKKDETNSEIKNIEKKLNDCDKQLNTLKDYKFNPDCDVCMSNDFTKLKIETEKMHKNLTKDATKCKKEIEKIDTEYNKYEKYDEMYKLNQNKIKLEEYENNKKKVERVVELKEMREKLLIKKSMDEISVEIEVYEKDKIDCEKEIRKCKKYNEMYTKNKENTAKIKEENMSIQNMRKDLEIIDARKDILNGLISQYKNMEEDIKKNKKLDDDMKKYNDEKKSLSKEMNDCDSQYTKINSIEELTNAIDTDEKIMELKKNEKELSILENECEKIAVNIDKNKKLLYTKNTKKIEEEIDIKTIGKYRNEVVKYEEEKDICDQVVSIINGNFVEYYMTNYVLPKFSDHVNKILETYVKFKIKMRYENKKIIMHKNDKIYGLTNANKLSGFENIITNITLKIAINEFNKQLRTNFMILDEVFSYSDSNNITKMETLFNFMRERYMWVMVVSHDTQIQTYTDKDICIEMKNGFSYVNIEGNKGEIAEKENIETKPKKKGTKSMK